MAKKGLGRGLGAIFGEETAVLAGKKSGKTVKTAKETAAEKNVSAETNEQDVKAEKSVKAAKKARSAKVLTDEEKEDVSRGTSMIRLSLIEPNASQPRKIFNEESLSELADSIREHGVLQPILVKQKGQMYEIVVGERRWRASKLAGLTEIPAIVKEMDSREAAEVALIENIQREDLGSVEEARAYKALIEEYGLTQEQLAQRVSKNRTTITNSMRLLQLDDEVLALLENGELSAGHARALLGINGKRGQYKAAREVVNNGLSVRQTEKLVKSYNRAAEKAKKEKADKDGTADSKAEELLNRELYLSAAERELTEIMNRKVSIRPTGKTKGKIEIEYYNDDELNEIIERLR